MIIKKKHRIHAGWISFLVLTVVVLLVLRSLKVSDLVNTLQQLVTSETKGQYALTIGDAGLTFRDLTITLKDLEIRKTGSSTTGKIESVKIPMAYADLGSLRSFLSVGQLDIQNLIIEEPHVVVKNNEAVADTTYRLNITTHLISLFKPIEALLKTLYIENFTIRQGGLGIKKGDDPQLELTLIDFLVADWNMRQLTEKSSIRVSIDKQQLALEKMTIGFSSIEYRYPQHFLSFNDVELTTGDSTHKSRIKSKSILISGLDYEELYYRSKYKLRKIEFEEPKVESQITNSGKHTDPNLILSAFHELFGEFELDSVIFKTGKLSIDIPQHEGERKISVDKFNLMLTGFSTVNPKQLSLGGIQLKINGLLVTQNSKKLISCDEMFFDSNRDFNASNFSMNIDAPATEVYIPRISIGQLDILSLYEKQIIRAEHIAITEPLIKVNTTDTQKMDNHGQPVSLDIQSATIENGRFEYQQGAIDVVSNGTTLTLGRMNSQKPQELFESLKAAHIGKLVAKLPDSLSITGNNLRLVGNSISFHSLDILLHQLKIRTQGLDTEIDALRSLHPSEISIQKFKLSDISVSGKTPDSRNPSAQSKSIQLHLNDLGIGNASVNVISGNKRVSFTGKDISIQGVEIGHQPRFDSISGNLQHLEFRTAKATASARSLILNSAHHSNIEGATIQIDQNIFTIASAVAGPVDFREGGVGVSAVRLFGLDGHKENELSMAVDSIIVKELAITPGQIPSAQSLSVYHPEISITVEPKKNKTEKGNSKALDALQKVFIYDGVVNINEKAIAFQSIEGNIAGPKKQLTASKLSFVTPNISMDLDAIQLKGSKLELAGFKFGPAVNAPKPETQKDVINVEIGRIAMTGLDIDAIVESGDINIDSLQISKVLLGIEKDKRLPPAPSKEKPFLLASLIPHAFGFRHGQLEDMNLEYTEISAKTGRTGSVRLHDIRSSLTFEKDSLADFRRLSVSATSRVYNSGSIVVNYKGVNNNEFMLNVTVREIDLIQLNEIIQPLLLIEIKDGRLREMEMHALANSEIAEASANMTYEDLHIQIHKRDDPDQKSLGSELLTLLADGIILKHSRENAVGTIQQPRTAEKSIFNYWVKTTSTSAMNIIRHGKKTRKR